jgi:hypothetical protein
VPLDELLQLGHLSFSQEGRGIGPLPVLDQRPDFFDSSRPGQPAKLVEGIFQLALRTGKNHTDEDCPLLFDAQVYAFWFSQCRISPLDRRVYLTSTIAILGTHCCPGNRVNFSRRARNLQ